MAYKIKELREKRKLTQAELADKANVSRTIIYRLENEREFDTSVSTLRKVAGALDVSVKSLFLP